MLENELWRQLAVFLAGFVLLTAGAEFLVRGASLLARRAGVSPVMIGLTVVAFGTSLPEFLVSLTANLRGNGVGEIAIGNIVGSNIANLALILGVAAILTVVPVDRQMRRREYPLLIGVTILFTVMAWNGLIDRTGGIILTLVLLGFTYYSYTAARFFEPEEAADVAEVLGLPLGRFKDHTLTFVAFVIIGMVGLVIGANWLVDSAQYIARALNVSELVIGLTLVAIGTSLPELATTVVAISRGESDIAVGNVIGSNLFNMLFIGGVSALIKPLAIPNHMFQLDFPVMIGATFLVFLMIMLRPHNLRRWHGVVLLSAYVAYTYWLFAQGRVA
jgi:cation:H+ antiporter